MSADERKDEHARPTADAKQTRRRAGGRRPQQHGPGFGPPGLIGTGEKAKNFKGSFKRLVGTLRPERAKIAWIIVLALFSVAATVSGPKIMGRVFNLIISGGTGRQLEHAVGTVWQDPRSPVRHERRADVAGSSRPLHVPDLDKVANFIGRLPGFAVGKGVDFAAVGKVLMILIAIYILSALFGWLQGYIMAGVVARTIYRSARTWTRSWRGCRSSTSTDTPAATSSAG